jgi:hypothetical protein
MGLALTGEVWHTATRDRELQLLYAATSTGARSRYYASAEAVSLMLEDLPRTAQARH